MAALVEKLRNGKRRGPLFEALAWLFLVISAYLATFGFDDPLPVYDFGPAHWPRVVLFVMFIAVCWMLYSEVWKAPESRSKSEDEEEDDDLLGDLETKTKIRVTLIFVLPVIYTYLIHKLGFILITPFFLFAYMVVMGVRPLRKLIIMTVAIYTAIILIFVKLIFTYLPPGAGVFNKINGTILGWLT